MKKKIDQSELVTNTYLDKKIDKIEIKIAERLALHEANINKQANKNKEELKSELRVELRAEIKEITDRQSDDLKASWSQEMDKFYQRIDPLLKEIVTAREDRVIATRDTEEIKTTLKNHEKRLQKLEKN